MKYDERITPFKKDLAHSIYKTIIKKKKYVEGSKHTVIKPFTPLYNKLNSKLSTQLLFGEECIVLEKKNKWSWIQSLRDQYVGYTPSMIVLFLSQPRIVIDGTFTTTSS